MKTLYSYFTLFSFILLYTTGTIQSMEPERSPYATRKLPPIPTQSPSTNQPSTPDIITTDFTYIENDLNKNQWIEVINNVMAKLQNLYHPNINAQSLQQFKKSMLNQNEYSIAYLNDAIKNSFGVGHVYLTRDKIYNIHDVPANYRNHIRCNILKALYHYDATQTNGQAVIDAKRKVSLKIFKSDKGDVPIITIPSFNVKSDTLINSLTKMTNILSRNYDYIMLDLRNNTGGDIGLEYYFLSLFLGNNDPDIYPVNLAHDQKLSYENLNKQLSTKKLPPFYQYATSFSVPVKKDTAETITFKKMVVLVNENTFSGGEIVAATLKNTLGSKVCILGTPCAGSFEDGNNLPINLPYDFKLHVSGGNMAFYSKKLAKLLTGCRLLPDITYDDMNTIKEKALDILYNGTPCSEYPSYERTIK